MPIRSQTSVTYKFHVPSKKGIRHAGPDEFRAIWSCGCFFVLLLLAGPESLHPAAKKS
ncbi:hypothetical protein FF011L_36520 [Roseimaritima multifibrata]|uniref:Uncharacterized protein n=1 Tax=Roseimaritima multifibrata TaxID=1930274 RepID=A0A517MJ49_9BACT|nr:hypothetical protein FF011L_36520 [Roseimaritima multifibrata]